MRWTDVDLERGTWAISGGRVSGAGAVYESTGKTDRSEEVLELDGWTVEVLRVHRKAQLKARLAAGPLWHDTGYVFTDAFGQPVYPDRIYRALKRHVERLGLPWISFKGLRHTWATIAFNVAKLPAAIVQEQLRHSSIKATRDVYIHLLPGAGRQAAEQVVGTVWAVAQRSDASESIDKHKVAENLLRGGDSNPEPSD